MTKTGSKIAYLEKIRVLAILLVLYCHSGYACLLAYRSVESGMLFWGALFMASVCQCCISLFFMISGAVLLRKNETVKQVLLHRFLPMLLTTCIVVLIQYVYNVILYETPFSFAKFLEFIYGGGVITEQWFLYAYLSFLLMLPLLQRLANSIEDSLFWYLLALAGIITVIAPMFEAVSDWKTLGLSLPVLNAVILMPLVGFFLANRPHDKLHSVIGRSAVGIILFIVAFLNTLMNYHSYKYGDKLAYDTLFAGVYAVGLFIVFFSARTISSNSILGLMGQGVFGTYLFERQFKYLVDIILPSGSSVTSTYMFGIVRILLTYLIGIIIINIIKVIVVKACHIIKQTIGF